MSNPSLHLRIFVNTKETQENVAVAAARSGTPDSYWDPDGGARKRRARDFGLRWLTVE